MPVRFISELGNDRVGALIRRFMEENNLPTDFVDCFPEGKSPISLAFLNEANDAQYLFYKEYPKQRLDVDFPVIEADDILIFGSYYSLNPVLRERMVELLEYARERKAIIYYDPNFRKAHAHEAIRLTPTILENMEYADIVRGSDEDFENIFGKKEMSQIYKQHIQFYSNLFITTHGGAGINLYHGNRSFHYDVPAIETVSTIGAGDNFNAGILFGLLKYEVKKADLATLSGAEWQKIIQCGIDLSSWVCRSYDNYISKPFAEAYRQKT